MKLNSYSEQVWGQIRKKVSENSSWDQNFEKLLRYRGLDQIYNDLSVEVRYRVKHQILVEILDDEYMNKLKI